MCVCVCVSLPLGHISHLTLVKSCSQSVRLSSTHFKSTRQLWYWIECCCCIGLYLVFSSKAYIKAQNPEYRRRNGANGRKWVEKCTIGNLVKLNTDTDIINWCAYRVFAWFSIISSVRNLINTPFHRALLVLYNSLLVCSFHFINSIDIHPCGPLGW